MDDTSPKASAQGKESVADEQGMQARLSHVTISLPSLVSTEHLRWSLGRLLT